MVAFKTIGRGRGFAPFQTVSFSDVDVGDAFQIINHMSRRGDKKQQVRVA